MQNFSQFNEQITKITLQYHNQLNPKIWKDGKIDGTVRTKLLEIARVWQRFAGIENTHVVDIILTGGNANFNYTSQSDLDVHIVVDYAKMNCGDTLLLDYFMAKKTLWSLTHKDIRVRGYPVEMFAEDKDTKPNPGRGVYSLLKGKWIQEPELQKLNFARDPLLKQKVSFFIKEVDAIIKGKQDITLASDLKDKIYSMRRAAIGENGEFSFENLIFKELRNRGVIDRLLNYIRTQQDLQLSLA